MSQYEKLFQRTKVLVIPGWQDSGPEHWQTQWEKAFGWTRVRQTDWMHPNFMDWTETIIQAVRRQTSPPVLVTHSLGGTALAHVVLTDPSVKIAGAFIVAPPDLDKPGTPQEILSFHPTPLVRFAFRSVVVASTDDPYCEPAASEKMASAWGSRWKCIGARDHLGSAANLGMWDEGQRLFSDALALFG